MRKNILITGSVRSGKTTLLKNILQNSSHTTGFITNEILVNDRRVGFEIETSKKERVILAHVDLHTEYKISGYFVDPQALDKLCPSIATFQGADTLCIDEIGPMQLFSRSFKELVLEYFNSPNTCVATIALNSNDDFIRDIKNRTDVIMLELLPETRDEQARFIIALINKINKARSYSADPSKFTRTESGFTLQSEHGIRSLSLTASIWHCDCDFYKEHNICSHTIAVDAAVGCT